MKLLATVQEAVVNAQVEFSQEKGARGSVRLGGPPPMATIVRTSASIWPVLLLCTLAREGQTRQSDETRQAAIELGRSCRAAIRRVPAGDNDFTVYIESPAGRVALIAAAAQMMGQSLEAPGVARAMKPGYRIWPVRTPAARHDRWVTGLYVQARGSQLFPTATGGEKLFLGSVPTHGIVPDLRDRRPQFTFVSLPVGPFDVALQFNDGEQRYRVERADASGYLPVCNR